jgi:hypothetical protein
LLIDVARLDEIFALELFDAATAQFVAEGLNLPFDAVQCATHAGEIEITRMGVVAGAELGDDIGPDFPDRLPI